MVNNLSKRFLACLMAILIVVTLLPGTVLAASVNTGVSGLTAESSGSASWNSSGGTVTGSVEASQSSGCTGVSYTAQSGTLTFTNSSGATALLSFDYALDLKGGSATVDGSVVSAGSGFAKKLAAGGKVAISITSPSGEGKTSIVLSNLALTPEQSITLTCKAPSHGSYTVDGTAITADTALSRLTTDSVNLAATPASGYKFLGWYSETEEIYFSITASLTTSFTGNKTIYPVFVSSSIPVFQVGSKLFTDLNEAISYSQSSGIAKIVLVSNGTLPAGTYTIPSGKTLLIPFDDAFTVFTSTPEVVYGAHVDPSAFRTLTMANGAKIVVSNGAVLSVPSKLSATGTGSGSWNGTPTGKHGRISMNAGSSIDVQSGGKLYAYGYISGSGNVYARSGSEIWECFQIRCWRGGTATSDMADNTQRVFPLNQYYVQNVEAPLTFYPGATEKVYTAVNMSSKAFAASATFIGSGGMFTINDGSVTKRFTGASDRLELNVDGNFYITPMSLNITGLPLIGDLNLNTADYVLPINSNITINVDTGNTIISQDVAFFPGTEMNIANGATVELSSGYKAYIYDQDQWGAYAAASLQLVPVGYSTVNGTTAKRTVNSLVDAKIDINGTFAAYGSAYTTESGAQIISSQGTGKYILQSAPGTESNTYQATQGGSGGKEITYVSIPITAARLQNADGSYFETAGKAAGTEIPYYEGEWGKVPPAVQNGYYLVGSRNGWNTDALDQDLMFRLNPDSNENEYQLTLDLTETEEFKVVGYEDGVVTWYPGGSNYVVDAAHAGAGKTVYFRPDANGGSDWHEQTIFVAKNQYTVTWKDDQGNELKKDEDVPYGTMPSYGDQDPVKEATDQYTYTFSGWSPELAPVTSDVTYTATFASHVRSYTITFLNEDGSFLWAGDFEYGSIPEYQGEIPVKQGDAEHSYTFAGWEPNVTEVTGPATYKAVYTEATNTYTVTWVNYNGDVLEKDENVPYGETPSYDGDEPEKPADAEFTYSFIGWTPEVSAVEGNATYTATFERHTRSYTITFQNEDSSFLWAGEFEYGTVPEYPYEDPVKESDAQYSYSFVGWEPEIVSVTGPATYTAVFNKTVNKYTVTWSINGNETTEEYEYGEFPSYKGENPVKEGNAQYSYEFTGWDPDIQKVTGNITYTAQFRESVNKYTVTWSINGEETTEEYEFGAVPSHENPANYEDENGSYKFIGWDPEIESVTGDVTYTAKFQAFLRNGFYLIGLRGWNYESLSADDRFVVNPNAENEYMINEVLLSEGDTLKVARVEYGEITGWFPDGMDNHYVVDAAHAGSHTVFFNPVGKNEWQDFGGYIFIDTSSFVVTWSVDGVDTYETYVYGQMPAHDVPVKAETMLESYEFAGWEPELTVVTGPVTYTAQFTAVPKAGWIAWEGQRYYIADGAPVRGVYEIEDEFYIFDLETGAFRSDANGVTDVGEDTYLAENGKVVKNPGLVRIPETEEYFYFGEDNKALKNQRTWIDRTNDLLPVWAYTFTETGAIEHVDVTWEGLQEDGYTYIDGIRVYLGLVQEADGSYHYYNSTGLHIVGRRYWISKTNPETVKDPNGNPFPEGSYEFDEQGRMILPGDPQAKNGIVAEDGSLYYYVDNVRSYAGLIQIDGDYYYVRYGGEVVHGTDYWVTKNNGLLPSARYQFADNGKLILEQPKNGIVAEDGSLFYYVDGARNYAGLIKIDGDYYYVRQTGELVHGTDYWVTKHNNLVPAGRYSFDEDGKMILTGTPLDPEPQPEVKNGVYEEDGVKYYYENGVKKYAGLIVLEDPANPGSYAYFYVTSSCQLKTSGSEGSFVKYTASYTNGLLPAARYQFDYLGRMYDLDGNLLTPAAP